jgi:hypothetical protein
MIYLACIFISPLALLLIGKPFQAIISLFFWLAAVILLITVFLFVPFGFGAWAIGALHAILAVNNHRNEKRTREMVEAMRGKEPNQ